MAQTLETIVPQHAYWVDQVEHQAQVMLWNKCPGARLLRTEAYPEPAALQTQWVFWVSRTGWSPAHALCQIADVKSFDTVGTGQLPDLDVLLTQVLMLPEE